jgi:Flp pilus assembly protein TadD
MTTKPGSARLLLAALSILILAGLPATLLGEESGEGWSLLETENFTLFSNLEEAPTREIGHDLEQMRAALSRLFPEASFQSPTPTYIYVFADAAAFAPYSLGGGEPGFFAPQSHANFAAVVGSTAAEAVPIVYRQYMHDLINHNVPQLPPWFRHGLAELMSTFEADARAARVGLVPSSDVGLTGSMSFAELLEAKEIPTGGEATGAFLERSRDLVHYLIVEESDRFAAAARFVDELEENPTSELNIADALGVSIDDLDGALRSYLAQEPLPHREIPLPEGADSGGSFEALAPARALFHLGDLLAHTQPARRADADALFSKSLQLSPGDAAATAGRGYVRQLDGDLQGARALYSEALEKLPDAFRLQFYFADSELELLGKRRPSNAEEEAALARAIAAFGKTTELRPSYGEGWARLGYAHNLETRPSPDALPALERAYEMLPGRSDVAYNLMLGYARAGKRKEAAELVETMEARGADEETWRRSREILFQLDFQYAGALAREQRFDDAVALYARIQAAAGDAGLRQRATESLAKIAPGATSNGFAESLLEAYQLYRAQDVAGAKSTLEALVGVAAPGMQQEMIEDLLDRL